MKWYTVLLICGFYVASTWLVLALAGEEKLIAWPNFIYWLATTASTVGYGDLSPATDSGKLWVAFYIIPFGLSLFALSIGRIAAWASKQWFKGVRGLKQLELSDHILVIGWNGARTLHLLNLLLTENADTDHPKAIVLCTLSDIENPIPGKIEFVKVISFNHEQDMARACISKASVIIIDNTHDDMTMTSALYCQQKNPAANLIAYFEDEALASLLKSHCPNIECTPSVAVEMLVKAAFDPGSSALHEELLNAAYGQAQYSIGYPENRLAIKVKSLFLGFKQHYQATLIGVAPVRKGKIMLNPDLEQDIVPGSILYYVADQRIRQIDWEKLDVYTLV